MYICLQGQHKLVDDDIHGYKGHCSKCKIKFRLYLDPQHGTTLQYYRDNINNGSEIVEKGGK